MGNIKSQRNPDQKERKRRKGKRKQKELSINTQGTSQDSTFFLNIQMKCENSRFGAYSHWFHFPKHANNSIFTTKPQTIQFFILVCHLTIDNVHCKPLQLD